MAASPATFPPVGLFTVVASRRSYCLHRRAPTGCLDDLMDPLVAETQRRCEFPER